MKDILNRLTFGRAFLLGLGLAGIYYFLMFDSGVSQTNKINSSKAQLAELQQQIHDNQVKLDRAAVFKKTAAETGTTINKLLGAIPEKFSVADLMKIVSNEAKVAGTSLINLTPGVPEISTVAKEFEEFTVSVDMNGSFLQHMVFLSNLTKINQILIIRKFGMTLNSRETKGDEAPTVHMIADIVAYRYRGTLASAATTGKGTETK